jgi:hypothetical protein
MNVEVLNLQLIKEMDKNIEEEIQKFKFLSEYNSINGGNLDEFNLKNWGKGLIQKLFFSNTVYDTIRKAVKGQIFTLKTCGILTAENPFNQEQSKEANAEKNAKLYDRLDRRNYIVMNLEGSYGKGPELSFLVLNISREDIIDLGHDFNQETVIFGEKDKDKEGVFTFHMVNSTGDNIGSDDGTPRSVVIFEDQMGEEDKVNLWSRPMEKDGEYGKKFNIPFYNKNVGEKSYWKDKDNSNEIIPVEEWFRGKIDKLIDESINDGKIYKHRYAYRYKVLTEIKRYQNGYYNKVEDRIKFNRY